MNQESPLLTTDIAGLARRLRLLASAIEAGKEPPYAIAMVDEGGDTYTSFHAPDSAVLLLGAVHFLSYTITAGIDDSEDTY